MCFNGGFQIRKGGREGGRREREGGEKGRREVGRKEDKRIQLEIQNILRYLSQCLPL
jgi:hypothetical protein